MKIKRFFKNQMKRGIYQLFSKALDKQLPWGNVDWNPSDKRLLFDGYKKEKGSEEIIHKIQKDYLASKEKASLCTETVQKERKLLKHFHTKKDTVIYRNTILPKHMSVLFILHRIRSINLNIVQDYLRCII